MKFIDHPPHIAGLLFITGASFLWAANPETDRSSANFDNKETGTLQHTKDGANRALNDVDAGVHTVVGHAKSDASEAKNNKNDALNSFDKGIHKAGHEIKVAFNHALDKVEDVVHGR